MANFLIYHGNLFTEDFIACYNQVFLLFLFYFFSVRRNNLKSRLRLLAFKQSFNTKIKTFLPKLIIKRVLSHLSYEKL